MDLDWDSEPKSEADEILNEFHQAMTQYRFYTDRVSALRARINDLFPSTFNDGEVVFENDRFTVTSCVDERRTWSAEVIQDILPELVRIAPDFVEIKISATRLNKSKHGLAETVRKRCVRVRSTRIEVTPK